MENMNGNMGFNKVEQVNEEVRWTTEKKLWNPKGFIILSVLFSFLPAAILYSLNYGRLGFCKKRNISLLISFIAFIGMISLAIVINQSVLRSIFYALNIGAAAYMNKDQSKLFEEHVQHGGRKASYLIPAIVCTIFAAAVMFMIIYSSNIPDQKMMFKGSEIYYTQNVQKSDVEKLGAYLSEQGFLKEGSKVSVKIDKKSSTYEFSLIIDKSKLGDKNLEESVKELSKYLSEDVFNNSKVDIILCDDTFKPLKTISR